MSSGVLITDVLSVQRNGAFCMVGSNAGIAIHGEFGLEEGSAFLAMPGTEIEMRGAVFANISTDPVALSGLANASFSFGWAPNPCPFEVAGVDIGPVMEGWTDNFAVGGLVLGRLGAGRIQLVDDCDNQLNGPRNEALYVHDLAFNSGGSIDLIGRNLYYLNGGDPRQFFFGDANLDGGVDGADYTLWADHYKMADMAWGDGDFNGDTVVDGADYTTWADNFLAGGARPAPEPATLSLLALGGLALIRRRR